MADTIGFPGSEAARGFQHQPRPGDAYQPVGQVEDGKPLSLLLVLADWSVASFPYRDLQWTKFTPLGGAGDRHGECVITLAFVESPTDGAIVTITGCNLYQLSCDIDEHRVDWIRQRPADRAMMAAPVVHTIGVEKAAGSTVLELLFSR